MADPFADLFAVKATGKEQAPTAGQQTSIMAQATEAQASKKEQQIKEQELFTAQQQNQQKKAVVEEGKVQRMTMQRQEQELAMGRVDAVQGLLQKSEQSDADLENRRDALEVESAAHHLALQDSNYVHQLRSVGRKRRLTDKLKFQDEMDAMVYGEELNMLMDELGWKDQEGQLARDRQKELFDIDVDTALAIAAADAEQKNLQTIMSGATQAATHATKMKSGKSAGNDVEITKTTEGVDAPMSDIGDVSTIS